MIAGIYYAHFLLTMGDLECAMPIPDVCVCALCFSICGKEKFTWLAMALIPSTNRLNLAEEK